MEYLRNMYGIFIEYVRNMYERCMEHAWDMNMYGIRETGYETGSDSTGMMSGSGCQGTAVQIASAVGLSRPLR